MSMPLLHRSVALAILALAGTACSSGPTAPADAATDIGVARDVVAPIDVPAGEASAPCTTNAMCDDGMYCDGAEQCAPGTAGADARGCVRGTPPCTMSQMCTEATRACTALGCTHPATPDMDGDGHADILCGGDDCADVDPHRFPGNPEVCLAGTAADGSLTRTGAAMVAGVAMVLDPTHDEDCDPTTFASATTHDGDHDGDGFVDTTCANTDRSGMTNHGTDCRDLADVAPVAPYTVPVPAANIHPTEPEVCNGVDDNCDGHIDEGLLMGFYPDCDADGHGDASATAISACVQPTGAPPCGGLSGTRWATTHDDCDDMSSSVYPGAVEACDHVDNDCNPATLGTLDADADGYVSMACCNPGAGGALACGPDCDDGDASVHPGAAEICDGLDQNCNRMRDEGLTGCSSVNPRANTVSCPGPCSTTSSVCCVGTSTPACMAGATCSGGLIAARCDGPEDCAAGNVCRLSFGTPLGTFCVAGPTLYGDLCHDLVDCPVGDFCAHVSRYGLMYGTCSN